MAVMLTAYAFMAWVLVNYFPSSGRAERFFTVLVTAMFGISIYLAAGRASASRMPGFIIFCFANIYYFVIRVMAADAKN